MIVSLREKFVVKRECRLMGNRFELSVVTDNEFVGGQLIAKGIAEIQRIEKLLTTFSDDSETNQVNQQAGIAPVIVSRETFDLIQRSMRISGITQGAFDITYGSIDKRLWNFDQQMTALPDKETARKMVRLIDYRNIELNSRNCTVFLKKKGMRIGFGGIGKGYAAERAKYIMKQAGADSGVVNASGDLTTWGKQPEGNNWSVGIVNPNLKDEVFSYLSFPDMAVATSGNYEKYAIIDGMKYSHTIDPRT